MVSTRNDFVYRERRDLLAVLCAMIPSGGLGRYHRTYIALDAFTLSTPCVDDDDRLSGTGGERGEYLPVIPPALRRPIATLPSASQGRNSDDSGYSSIPARLWFSPADGRLSSPVSAAFRSDFEVEGEANGCMALVKTNLEFEQNDLSSNVGCFLGDERERGGQ
ncbi:hypothetical protein BDY19DRAFT_905552 [Irpex rosettiformis]|uniref:Uncharacterized protein n=1 Tax=Irpex rosettiformis TaxID=378272 RepID=A0ACB8U609_9APHY|nr:hypothetical protein BDY19DRAFT_905552 [Irpex rosettiformis]